MVASFGGKALTGLATAGSVSATVAVPYASKMAYQISLSNDSAVLSDLSEEEVSSSDEKNPNLIALLRIKNWLVNAGSCKFKFTLSAKSKEYLEFESIKESNNFDSGIFLDYSKLKKSKFVAFADELESLDSKFSNYVSAIKNKCQKSSQTITLHWRDSVNQRTDIKTGGANNDLIKDLKNAWIDGDDLKIAESGS